MICNITSHIETEITSVYLMLTRPYLNEYRILSGHDPYIFNYALQHQPTWFPGEGIRMVPHSTSINSRQRENKSNIYWDHRFDFTVAKSTMENFKKINFFTNKDVALIIHTNKNSYIVGYWEQPLKMMFNETEDTLNVNVAGRTYFPSWRTE